MTQQALLSTVPAAHRQAKYQVRFDWGVEGAVAVAADADVVVWVDALPADAGAPAAPADLPGDGAVLVAGLTDAAAVAQWILDEQVRLGRRAMISLVAAGATTPAGSPRFAVEDLLAAGAVVDALAALGIDYSSPEAAAACASFTGLRGAVAHLLTASVSGQERIAAGEAAADIAVLGRLGTSDAVTVLRASRQSGAPAAE
ncbi:2-phosphosulfolactate phosphatase [Leifsonia virtsii]|uniref:Probable 2-phosphosulfolactate phosphatase n=1 Tax=Leifsonia virtsii TaxID=3035915 RepID=A0ABT8IY72_9MICO|nr:2-phosphosulfolactate phosphatase [Leifsonia virtsii]MDN4597317.1 2-phosphosulfolactate phosphatase [Leifsonia virtsii]